MEIKKDEVDEHSDSGIGRITTFAKDLRGLEEQKRFRALIATF